MVTQAIDAPAPAAIADSAPLIYVPKRAPRVRQAEALEKMRGKRAFALRMSMRTGKSACLVNDWGRMVIEGTIDDLLVIAPGGVYRTWPGHLAADLPDAVTANMKTLVWDSGRARTKGAALARDDFLAHRGPRALVMNVEAISAVKAARELCVAFVLQRRSRAMIAVDESVVIKNSQSVCGEFVAGTLAPLARYRRILTGLIAPQSPLDLWNQFRFLDPYILGQPSFATFRARYARVKKVCMWPNAKLRGALRSRLGLANHLTEAELQRRVLAVDRSINPNGMDTRAMREFLTVMSESLPRERVVDAITALGGYVQTVPIVEEYVNTDELAAKIEPHSYRCRLEDCYDMPKSNWSMRDVELHPEQERVYESIRKTAAAELASMDHVTATHVVVRMLRLHQVLCGHVIDDDGTVHSVPERRTAALLSLLADYDGKAVIWCSYRYNVERVRDALVAEYGPGSVACFWGGNVDTREEEETRFKVDSACRFEVATPDAGGRGRDWSVADLCVYYSSRNNLDHRNQSEERVKADGKVRPIAYVDLRAPGTVDDKFIYCLREKIDLAAVVDGDEWREWVV